MAAGRNSRILEFNVGAMTLLAFAFFAWMILFVGDVNPFGRDYFLYADFAEVQLLQGGDAVRKNGLVIGKVNGFRFVGNLVRVRLQINEGYQVRKDAVVAVGNVGLFGANYVKITEPELPEDADSPGHYQPDDIIAGHTAPDFESLLSGGNELLDELKTTVQALQAILDDEEFRENILATTREVRQASAAGRRSLEDLERSLRRVLDEAESAAGSARRLIEHEGGFQGALDRINTFLDDLSGIAGENRSRLRRTTEAVMEVVEEIRDRAVAARIAGAADELEKLTREMKDFVVDLNKNGETPDRIRRITDRLETITRDVAVMTGATREAVEESHLEGNLSRAFDDVHTISSRVDELGDKLGEIRTELVASLFYSDAGDDFRPELALRVDFGSENFGILGVEDIGNGDDLDLQAGFRLSSRDQARVGIIADEFGIGYDRFLFRRAVQLRIEAYRPDDLLYRYAARFRIRRDSYVTFRLQDEAIGQERLAYVGLETHF